MKTKKSLLFDNVIKCETFYVYVNSPAFQTTYPQKIMFDIARILSKSPALNHSVGRYNFIYLATLLTHHLAIAVRYEK